MKTVYKIFSILFFMCFFLEPLLAQEKLFKFGVQQDLNALIQGKKAKGKAINWIDVNTGKDTWRFEGDELICEGLPIGVIRSENQYENFIMYVEWKHMSDGGNSGTFVWSDATPGPNDLPNGLEVQMLELDWVNQHKNDKGELPPIAYVHGELFGVGGVETVPDTPRGTRSKSIENRCLGKGQWNTYVVVAVDGVVKLSVNGKFVNGISKATQKKGYICLESEGAPIHFRNLTVTELPPGVTSAEQIAPLLNNP